MNASKFAYRAFSILSTLGVLTAGLMAQSTGQSTQTPYRDQTPVTQQPTHPDAQSPYDRRTPGSISESRATRDTVPARAQSDWSWLGTLVTGAIGFGLGYLLGGWRRERYPVDRRADRDRDRVA